MKVQNLRARKFLLNVRNENLSMGNLLRSQHSTNSDVVTPYSLESHEESESEAAITGFNWGYSGSKQHMLNYLGNKLQNVGSTEQFIETFKRSVKPEDIKNIRELFDSVEFTLPQTIEALHFYTAIHCHCTDVFVQELLRCRHLFGESSDVSFGTFMERHCRGVMITHCYIVENLESMVLVDQILNAIASGHVFLSKLSLSIKKHDDILYNFLKHEFCEYKSKATFISLRKYFKVITARIQYLIEKKVLEKSIADMIDGMEFLKNIHNLCSFTRPGGSIKELYRTAGSLDTYGSGSSFASI